MNANFLVFLKGKTKVSSNDFNEGVGFLILVSENIKLEAEKVCATNWISPITTEKIEKSADFNQFDLVFLKPGATDTLALGALEAMRLASGNDRAIKAMNVRSFKYFSKKSDHLKAYFNSNIHSIVESSHQFDSLIRQLHLLGEAKPFRRPEPIVVSETNIQKLNLDRNLAFSKEEIKKITEYFCSLEVQKAREKAGLHPMISEIEIELLAQTWSEHCKHKIFNAEINYVESPEVRPFFGNQKINSLFKTFIQRPTLDLIPKKDFEISSVFKDNAGIVSFDSDLNICVKVETHNSPSALDPYSGALTGVLGVNRDILGTGIGARPIANIDVLGFCSPQDFPADDSSERPVGLLRPEVIMKGVHDGIEAAGNQSGIPTIAGALTFDPEFSGKPLVFAGSVGAMPKIINGVATYLKDIRPGDLIFVGGGRAGRDGIHGATMSSLALTESITSSMVQLGDPYTQKKLSDFLLKARDLGYYRTLTDNGAGGLSSSVGELAYLAGGARLDLAQVPLKYSNMQPWEILVSESQERMTFVVPPEKREAFDALAIMFDVEVKCLGEFNETGVLDIFWKSQIIAQMPLQFLHEGCPQLKLNGRWTGPISDNNVFSRPEKKPAPEKINARSLREVFEDVLLSPELSSREKWIRSFDHEVQGTNLRRAYSGPLQNAPLSGNTIDLGPLGSKKGNAISIGLGIKPYLSKFDPYFMAVAAFDEAVRNLVCTGADPDRVVALDNFSWPDPVIDETKMGQLVRANMGLKDSCVGFQIPLISGKDSLKNDFSGKNQKGDTIKISSPPTLLVSLVGEISSIKYRMQTQPQVDDLLFLIGFPTEGLSGSVYDRIYSQELDWNFKENDFLKLRQFYRLIHTSISNKMFTHIQDVSDGGLMTAAMEMAFFGSFGLELNFSGEQSWKELFSEPLGTFVVSLRPQMKEQFESTFKAIGGLRVQQIGKFTGLTEFRLNWKETTTFTEMDELKKRWQGV